MLSLFSEFAAKVSSLAPDVCSRKAEHEHHFDDQHECEDSSEKAGVGCVLIDKEKQVVFGSLAIGGPAEMCGKIGPGDLLLSVDNVNVFCQREAAKLILGMPNTEVILATKWGSERNVCWLKLCSQGAERPGKRS